MDGSKIYSAHECGFQPCLYWEQMTVSTFMIELINRIVYDEIKNHSELVMYLALLEFNLRENVVTVFKLNMTVW